MSRRNKTPRACWYENGLEFACTQCGNCCVVEGYVWVDKREMDRIAKHLSMPFSAFTKKYVRRVGRKYSLIENPDHSCVFWENGCTIYDARPNQCRTWPFWPENLESEEAWDETAAECPGIGGARHYSRDEIDELSKGKGETG